MTYYTSNAYGYDPYRSWIPVTGTSAWDTEWPTGNYYGFFNNNGVSNAVATWAKDSKPPPEPEPEPCTEEELIAFLNS